MQTSKPTCAEASHVGPASGHLWLASAGGLLTAFIAHRAEVHAGELLLWSTRGASAPPIVAARVIALAGASIFPVGRTGFRSWCFAVVPDGETNGHTFAAASEVELACWLRDLRVVAFELRSVARPRPRRALLLYGRGGGGHLASALAVRDCLAGPLEGRAAAMLAECYAAEARAATVAPAVEASACKAELPAAPPELELVDVGRVVDEIVLGGWLSRALPFGGDDVYNWLLSHGCYALAALGTRLSARVSARAGVGRGLARAGHAAAQRGAQTGAPSRANRRAFPRLTAHRARCVLRRRSWSGFASCSLRGVPPSWSVACPSSTRRCVTRSSR